MEIDHSENSSEREIVFSIYKGYLFSFILSGLWFLCCWLAIGFLFGNHEVILEGAKKTFFHVEFGLPVFIAGMIVRECLKSLVLKFYANIPWNAQNTGFSMSSLMPYVQSKYPIPARKYALTLLIPPFILIQIIWLSFIYQYGEWIILSTLWLFFSGFDILTAFKLYKYKSFLAADHPDLPGAIIYENPF